MEGVFSVVRAFILADPVVTALIGTRLYPIKAPQAATYPLVTMQKIVEVRFPHLRGAGGLAAPRYQIDAWVREAAGTPGFVNTQALAEAIRERIDGFSGELTDESDSPSDRLQVSIHFDDSRDLFETDEATGGYYRTSTDYVIWHRPVTA